MAQIILPMAKGGPYVKDVYRDENTGEFSIAFAAPVLKNAVESF